MVKPSKTGLLSSVGLPSLSKFRGSNRTLSLLAFASAPVALSEDLQLVEGHNQVVQREFFSQVEASSILLIVSFPSFPLTIRTYVPSLMSSSLAKSCGITTTSVFPV